MARFGTKISLIILFGLVLLLPQALIADEACTTAVQSYINSAQNSQGVGLYPATLPGEMHRRAEEACYGESNAESAVECLRTAERRWTRRGAPADLAELPLLRLRASALACGDQADGTRATTCVEGFFSRIPTLPLGSPANQVQRRYVLAGEFCRGGRSAGDAPECVDSVTRMAGIRIFHATRGRPTEQDANTVDAIARVCLSGRAMAPIQSCVTRELAGRPPYDASRIVRRCSNANPTQATQAVQAAETPQTQSRGRSSENNSLRPEQTYDGAPNGNRAVPPRNDELQIDTMNPYSLKNTRNTGRGAK